MLGQLIFQRLETQPDRIISRFISGDSVVELSAGDLTARAVAVAGALSKSGLPSRSIIGVSLYSGPALHAAWLGCIWAGYIPTMLAPPSPRMEPQKYAAGLGAIVRHLGLQILLVEPASEVVLKDHLPEGLRLLRSGDVAAPLDGSFQPSVWSPDEVIVVQHSSGTTGQPKSVALTSQQILDHQAAYGAAIDLQPSDRIVSWLPLYHDMGFVAAFLQPLITGVELIEMSPFEWAARPAMLLEVIDRYAATLCWMPNFAFTLLAQPRTLRDLKAADLSSVRLWVNCSEPVMAKSVDEFTAALSGLMVRPDSVVACYAMAENVFAVSQARPGQDRRLIVDREALERERRIEPAPDGVGEVLVSNGTPLPTTEVRIVSDDGVALDSDRVGEIQLRGAHRFWGYHQRPDLTQAATSADGWYATGDLGCFVDGQIYVVGRKKDMIIIRGRNYRGQDMEEAVGAIEGVKMGRVAAFGVADPASGTDRLVILLEAEAEASPGALNLEVRKCIAQTFDTVVSDVRIVEPRWLVKSSSGKLARADNRDKYLRHFGGRA